jgi:hypothetical protein
MQSFAWLATRAWAMSHIWIPSLGWGGKSGGELSAVADLPLTPARGGEGGEGTYTRGRNRA